MCFHFVLFVALVEFVANPSNPPTRTNKAQARQHQPLLLGYLVTSQNTGVCCFPVAKLLSIGGLPLPLSQTRDWTTLSRLRPMSVAEFLYASLALPCPACLPHRILSCPVCLRIDVSHAPRCIAAYGSNRSNPRSWACLLFHPIGTSSAALACVCQRPYIQQGGVRIRRGSAGGRFVLL